MSKYYKKLPNGDWVEIDNDKYPFYNPEFEQDTRGGLLWIGIGLFVLLLPIVLPLIFDYFGVLDWLL